MDLDDRLNQRDNEYKLKIAQIAASNVEEDTKDLDSAKLDLDRKKHDDEVAIKVAEMIEKKRNNMANEKIGMKKAMAKPKTTKK